MEKNEIVIWHEMDGVGDSSLKFIESICHELEIRENFQFKFVQMNIAPFLERLNNLEEEKEKPDVIFIAQDMVTLEKANLSEVPEKFSQYMDKKIWDSMKYKGIQRGVPYVQGNHAVIFYNKKYFAKKPETWEQIRKFKRDKVCNFSMDLEVVYWLMPFIYSIYGNPITDGIVTITTENTMEVQNFILDLIRQGILCCYSAISTMLEKFVAGEIACMINGEWLYEYLNKEMGEQVGICGLPNIGNMEMTGVSSSVGMAFPQNSLQGEKGKALEKFIDAMLSKEVQEKWLVSHKRIPVNKKVLADMNQLETDKNVITSYEQMKKNYFLVNEECINDLWHKGEQILVKIIEDSKLVMNKKEV
ncbi:MAG: ABC transporter substrate-binding protein [Lachnospiraceae bacterium]|nr:ABC transporter substrate-binding protein [Lachnospiraceae bacterium]